MHANAALTPRARLKLGRLVVVDKVTVADAARRFQCSYATAKRWARRFRELHEAGVVVTPEHLADRSSRLKTSPTKTPQPLVRKIVHVRWKRRVGPVEIAGIVNVPESKVHAVLKRCGISRLSQVDRVTREPVRRYEHERPGDLLHQDVEKLGNVPDGGGWRMVGRHQGQRNRTATPTTKRGMDGGKNPGHAFVHGRRRPQPRRLRRDPRRRDRAHRRRRAAPSGAVARGVTVQRVLTDNGSCYRSYLWRQQCQDLDLTHKRTRPYRPQTNGKVEGFHRTMTAGWAFRRLYISESARRKALPAWLHEYRHHRLHSAIGRTTPISRLTNRPGQNN